MEINLWVHKSCINLNLFSVTFLIYRLYFAKTQIFVWKDLAILPIPKKAARFGGNGGKSVIFLFSFDIAWFMPQLS